MLLPSESAEHGLSFLFSSDIYSLLPPTTCFLMSYLISPHCKSFMKIIVIFLKNSQTRIIPQVFTFMDIAQIIVKFCVMHSIYSLFGFAKRFRYQRGYSNYLSVKTIQSNSYLTSFFFKFLSHKRASSHG